MRIGEKKKKKKNPTLKEKKIINYKINGNQNIKTQIYSK